MKIKEMNIGGFGVWQDLSVVEFPDETTVFYGRNEAGKTTLMQFMRSVLYGFSEERQKRYVPPVYGGLAGGSLEIESEEGRGTSIRVVLPIELPDTSADVGEQGAQS